MEFLRKNILPVFLGCISFMLLSGSYLAYDLSASESFNSTQVNDSIFNILSRKAENEQWNKLIIGECIARTGKFFMGTNYVAGTLDTGLTEKCVIKLDGLDCVTFMENCLCFSRILKRDSITLQNFIDEVTFTRYRHGKLAGYTSRLHYTADWISDNIKKGVVEDITRRIGGKKIKFNLGFMSSNSQFYRALKDNPSLIKQIKTIEDSVNNREFYFISKEKIASIEKYIKNGDIIAIVTSKKGLDYSHIGLACKDDDGKMHLLHASSKYKKVFFDKTIHEYVNLVDSNTGITILRPIEISVNK